MKLQKQFSVDSTGKRKRLQLKLSRYAHFFAILRLSKRKGEKKLIDKEELRQQILTRLRADHQLLLQAAQSSHAAATHEENIPDSKYETLALEASYIAQGQANRAQEIKQAIDAYRKLVMLDFDEQSPIRVSALVHLEDETGNEKRIFIGPAAGGLTLSYREKPLLLITPESPLGQELIGCRVDDCFQLEGNNKEYEIISVE